MLNPRAADHHRQALELGVAKQLHGRKKSIHVQVGNAANLVGLGRGRGRFGVSQVIRVSRVSRIERGLRQGLNMGLLVGGRRVAQGLGLSQGLIVDPFREMGRAP